MPKRIVYLLILGIFFAIPLPSRADCAGFDIDDTMRQVRSKFNCWQGRVSDLEAEIQKSRLAAPSVRVVILANPRELSAAECKVRAVETFLKLGYKVVNSSVHDKGRWVISFERERFSATITCIEPPFSPAIALSANGDFGEEFEKFIILPDILTRQ